MEDSIEEKQQFLRSEILDKGYDPNQFGAFLVSKKGEDGADLTIWSIAELQQVVGEFIASLGDTSPQVQNLEQNQIEETKETESKVENQPQNEQIEQKIEAPKEQQPHKDFTKVKGKISEKTELGKFNEVTINVSSPEK